MYLKMELSDYKTRLACSNSRFFKELGQNGMAATMKEAMASLSWDKIEEIKDLGSDTLCHGVALAYKYSAGYGHQIHNVFVVIAFFVLLFWWLLKLDSVSATTAPAGSQKEALGLLYSIDMFVPFVRLNRAHSNMQPNSVWLKVYLILHRVLGLILTSMLVLGLWVEKH
jgi:hypothetical protein